MATNITQFITKDIFKIIGNTADSMGIRVYVVGGFVRDCFLDRKNDHIEIVVESDGIAFGKTVGNKTHVKVSFFKNYGVSILKYKGDEIIFSGAKQRIFKQDEKKPSYAPGTIEDDLRRRDFTINSLALSLNLEGYGRLIDINGGLNDLAQGLIRTPIQPDYAFRDKPLSILTAIRLVAQLSTQSQGFHIASDCLSAIVKCAAKVDSIPKELVSDELDKILLCDVPSLGIRILDEVGILKRIIPSLSATKGVEVIDGIGHENSFPHSLMVLDNTAKLELESTSDVTNSLGIKQGEPNLWLRWAALLHEIGKPASKRIIKGKGWTFYGYDVLGAKMVANIFSSLRMPMDERMKYVRKLIALQNRPKMLLEEDTSESAYRRLLLDAGEDIQDLLLLCQANVTTTNKAKANKAYEGIRRVKQQLLEVKERDAIRNFKNPISADYIMDLYGIGPCNTLSVLKNFVRDAILCGEIGNSFEEADILLRKKAYELGLKINDGSTTVPRPEREIINECNPVPKNNNNNSSSGITENGIRVNKILRQFNIGFSTLENFLKENGIVDTITVNSKLPAEVFAMVAREFGKVQFREEQEGRTAVVKSKDIENNCSLNTRIKISDIIQSLNDNAASKLLNITSALSQRGESKADFTERSIIPVTGIMVNNKRPSCNVISYETSVEELVAVKEEDTSVVEEVIESTPEELSIQPEIVLEESQTVDSPVSKTKSTDIIRYFNEYGISKLYYLSTGDELDVINKGQALVKDRFILFTHDTLKEEHGSSLISLEVSLLVLNLPGTLITFEELLSNGITLCTEVTNIIEQRQSLDVKPLISTKKHPHDILSSCVVIVKNNIPAEYILNQSVLNEQLYPSLPY